MTLARNACFNQSLTLWCAFGVCVILSSSVCNSPLKKVVKEVVVEEEEEALVTSGK